MTGGNKMVIKQAEHIGAQFPKLKNKTIAIIGLGYVGLPLAVAFAKYHSVIGFDKITIEFEIFPEG